jgi:hypothetical protein
MLQNLLLEKDARGMYMILFSFASINYVCKQHKHLKVLSVAKGSRSFRLSPVSGSTVVKMHLEKTMDPNFGP